MNKSSNRYYLSPSRLTVVSLLLLLFSCANVSFGQDTENQESKRSKNITTEAGVKYYLHTVEKGQTLFAIGKIYGRTVNDIVIENPEAIDGIKPGQIIKIPFDKSKPKEVVAAVDSAKYIFHKVEKGQTVYSITKQYNITEAKLKAVNPELADGLKIGQQLKIPVEKKPKETAVKDKETKKDATAKTDKKENTEKKEVVQKDKTEPTTKEKEKTDTKSDTKTLKKDKGAKTEKPIAETGPPNKPEIKEVPKTPEVVSPYTSNMKDEYSIAFFLPFHSEEAMAIDVDLLMKGDEQLPNKTSVALAFYEGALIAIDSLKKQKLNAKIYVYDIDDKDSANVITLLQKPELTKMDLMIGPLYGSSFIPVSKFAKEHNIAIVSPFIQANKILFNNPFVCKVLPSTTLHVEQMAHYVIDSFRTQNIILVDNSLAKEAGFFNAFKTTANNDLTKAGGTANDTVKIAKGLSGVEGLLSADKTNVVVYPSNSQSAVTEFVRGLNNHAEKKKIVLFGLQSWTSFDNLDFDYLNKLNLHFPSNTFVDYQNVTTQNVIRKYREKYQTEPDMYVYQGFDISYYFISRLQKSGTGFMNTLSDNNYKGIETNFNFKQFPENTGYENKFVRILKYNNYKLVSAN